MSPPGFDAAVAETATQAQQSYRWFHQHPELSRKEEKTADKLADDLESLGLQVIRNVGGYGIVATLEGNTSKGPVILYRADMDGLPVTENTGVAYASKNSGVMHACGHDVHMATAVGTLAVLAKLKAHWNGTVLFVGQPAEEVGAGAREMLKHPALKGLLRRLGKPKLALALHDSPHLSAGKGGLLAGFANANVDSVDIIVHGQGGHGAFPHETVDPIVIGSEIVLALQTIVSRKLPPGEKAVVTVGSFQAGTKHNIIGPSAHLKLTVRSYADETRNRLIAAIRNLAKHVDLAHGAPRAPEVRTRDEYTPAAYNDPKWVGVLRHAFVNLLGKHNVETYEPSTGGEDFGRYSRQLKIPGVMYILGAAHKKHIGKPDAPGLHSDRWAPDYKPTLKTGVRTMVTAILTALGAT
jgi:hippurate hydrolase